MKRLTSCLLFVMFNCVFVTFPCGILGQVWHLIVSIPDLCRLFIMMPDQESFNNILPSKKPPPTIGATTNNEPTKIEPLL